MLEYWAEHGPPVYLSVAGYLGMVKPKKKPSRPGEKPAAEGNLNDLLRLAGPGGMIN